MHCKRHRAQRAPGADHNLLLMISAYICVHLCTPTNTPQLIKTHMRYVAKGPRHQRLRRLHRLHPLQNCVQTAYKLRTNCVHPQTPHSPSKHTCGMLPRVRDIKINGYVGYIGYIRYKTAYKLRTNCVQTAYKLRTQLQTAYKLICIHPQRDPTAHQNTCSILPKGL